MRPELSQIICAVKAKSLFRTNFSDSKLEILCLIGFLDHCHREALTALSSYSTDRISHAIRELRDQDKLIQRNPQNPHEYILTPAGEDACDQIRAMLRTSNSPS